MRLAKRRSRRPTRRDRSRAVMEALEPRVLLSVYLEHDTGNIATNGTNLQNRINSCALGDTIVLDAGVVYLSSSSGFTLPYKTGTGTLTIESSDIYNGLGHLPAGVRVGGSVAQYMPKLETPGYNAVVMKTVLKDSSGATVTTGAHDYALLGLEFCPLNATDGITTLVALGDGGSAQDTIAEVAHHITVDRCYIHGLDPVSSTSYANIQHGLALNGADLTVSNSEVSNIKSDTPDSNGICGWNGTGNYTITNNYLEASSECFIMGGATTYIPNNLPSNITFTGNHLAKRLSWNAFDPAFYAPDSTNLGIKWNIKNLFELKAAQNVLIDGNLMDNSWIGGDQVGAAVLFTPKDGNGLNPWNTVAYVTMTNNVIRNVGEGIQMSGGGISDNGYPSSPSHDFTIRNNVIENVSGAGCGPAYGMIIGRGVAPIVNLAIDHNTFYDGQCLMYLDSGSVYQSVAATNFVVTNNVFQYAGSGIMSTPGSNQRALNIYATGISITSGGTGYTSVPTIQFQGGGGSGATGVAQINTTSHTVKCIEVTNRGSGYTSVPQILITNGGGTGAAASFDTGAITNGQLGAWTFTNNLIFGAGSPATPFPAGNFVPSGASGTEDAVFIRDPAGELNGLLSASPGYNNATTGSYYPHCGADPSTLAPDFVPTDATVQGYWKFDEGAGSTVSDSTGNGKTGTLSGSPLPAWTTSGQSYDAVTLGGTGGYVSVPGFATSATFSFAAWVKPGTITANSYIASAGNSAFSLYVNSAGKLVATTSNGATVTDTTALAAGTWYLAGCTYDSVAKKLTLYKNGASVGSYTGTGTIASGSTTLYLGDNGGTAGSFNGSIDEARYYNSDMSALNYNGLPGMQQLYSNFRALINQIYPNGSASTATSTLSLGDAISHYTYQGATDSLIYTWSVKSGPAAVDFAASNGTTAGNSCLATWHKAGLYVMQLDITSPVGDRTVILHPINVTQTPTSVSVSPATASLSAGGTQQFTNNNSGVDQFGDALTGAWTWSVATGGAGGTVDSNGFYNAPPSAGADVVNLKYGSTIYSHADVTVTGTAATTVTVSATDGTGSEAGTNPGQYTFTRTGSTSGALTVNYSISGTATNGADYSTLGTTVVIPTGSASQAVTLTVINDTLIEAASEKAILTLTNGTGYAIGSLNIATVGINDDDKPSITISATTPTGYEAGPTNGVFTVTRSGTYQGTPGALAVVYNISGTAGNIADYARLPNSVVFLPGQTSATITITPVDDTYMESTETVILTLTTGSGSYTVGSPSVGTVSIVDNDTTPTVTISATTPSASETGPVNGVFTVTRNGSTSGALTVNYSISGSATNTSDYSTLATTVVIPNGSASATITISTINDTLIEGTETAVLTVTTGTGYVIGEQSVGTVTIADNDVPSATISATTPSASEQGPVNGVFTVTRSGSGPALLTGALTVNYSKSGTATNGTDYSTLGTTVVIPNGTASATITVAVIDDTVYESSETAILTVTTGTGYTVGSPSIGTVTIADNDMTVSVSATDASAAEDGASGPDAGVYTFTRVGSTASALTVNYTMSGTATSGTDYTAPSGSVVIPSGSASATVTLTPIRDDVLESTETAVLTITSGTGYTVGSPSVGTVDIADNGLAAYDGFNYADVASWNGHNTGVGFSANWTVDTAKASITSDLTYSASGCALKTSGNSVHFTGYGYGDTTLASSIGTIGTTLWVGMEFQVASTSQQTELDINSTAHGKGVRLGASIRVTLASGGDYFGTGGFTPVVGTTYFMAYKIDYLSTGSVIKMYKNPTPGTIPTTATGTLTLPSTVTLPVTGAMTIYAASSPTVTTFDEIRFGSTYYAVAPDPIIEGHGKKGKHAQTGLPSAAPNHASSRNAAAFLAAGAAEQLLSASGAPDALALTGLRATAGSAPTSATASPWRAGPIAKAAAAQSWRSVSRAFSAKALAAQPAGRGTPAVPGGDSPFDSLSAISLAAVKLLK